MQIREAEKIGRVVSERQRVGKSSATAERIARAGGLDAVEHVAKGEIQRLVTAPLDRLQKDRVITRREHDAGDWLRATAYMAAIDVGAMTVDWERAGGGGRSSRVPAVLTVEEMVEASQDWRAYCRDVRGVVRTVLDLVVIHEQALEEVGKSVGGKRNDRDARSWATGAIRVALGALADWRGR